MSIPEEKMVMSITVEKSSLSKIDTLKHNLKIASDYNNLYMFGQAASSCHKLFPNKTNRDLYNFLKETNNKYSLVVKKNPKLQDNMRLGLLYDPEKEIKYELIYSFIGNRKKDLGGLSEKENYKLLNDAGYRIVSNSIFK